jgi:copper(I)-binding protein
MNKTFALPLVALAYLAASSSAVAHSHKKKTLEVVHPSTAATTSKEVPVYMVIKNGGRAPERLLGASSPIAAKIELLQGTEPANYVVPAGKSLALTQTGPHLLLSGVKQRLKANTTFKMTLQFEKMGPMRVDVMVEEEAEAKEPHKQ